MILQRHLSRSFPQQECYQTKYDTKKKSTPVNTSPSPSPVLFSPSSLPSITSTSPLSQSQSSSSLSQIQSSSPTSFPSSTSSSLPSEKQSVSELSKSASVAVDATGVAAPSSKHKTSHSHSHWWSNSYLNLTSLNFMKAKLGKRKKKRPDEKEMIEMGSNESADEKEESHTEENSDEIALMEEQIKDNDILATTIVNTEQKPAVHNIQKEKNGDSVSASTKSDKADATATSKTPIKMIWFDKQAADGKDSQKEDLRKKRNEEILQEKEREEMVKKEMREDTISLLDELKAEAAKLPAWQKEHRRLTAELYRVVFGTPWAAERALRGVESRTDDARFYLACRYYVASHDVSDGLDVPVSYLNQIPEKESPLDKIALVISAMKAVCEQLKLSHSECSADDLLTRFIDCIASCDVRNLVTERAFMEAYLPLEVRKDEEGFALVNFTGAMKVIEREEESVSNDL